MLQVLTVRYARWLDGTYEEPLVPRQLGKRTAGIVAS